jgi:hypothetical protein
MINLGHFVIGRKHEFCVIDLFEIDASLNLSANFGKPSADLFDILFYASRLLTEDSRYTRTAAVRFEGLWR